jgi:hypothetical protein
MDVCFETGVGISYADLAIAHAKEAGGREIRCQ